MIDTGSWVLVSRRIPPYRGQEAKAIEAWCGLSVDFDLVPKTGCTGSTAYCIDTGAYYMFEETTDTWYPIPSAGEGSTSVPGDVDMYTGAYDVVPQAALPQVLPTSNKFMQNNVVVNKIPYAETCNQADGVTASIAS